MLQAIQGLDTNIIIVVLIIFCFILLALIINLLISMKSLKSRFDKILIGTESGESLENAILSYYNHVKELDSKYYNIEKNINYLYNNIKPCIQKVGMVRYNPFEDMGGDLSYALALLDEDNNGFVINTIMTRDSSRTYCKPINNCESEYPLSYEEELSIKRAIGLAENTPRGKKARGIK